MREFIGEESYDIGKKCTFRVYKTRGKKDPDGAEMNEIECSYQFEDQEEPFVFRRIFYTDEAAAFQSPLLSWYNLIFCSNNYGPIPVVSYMNHAVQEGKKLAATIYPVDNAEFFSILQETEKTHYCFPYNPREYSLMLYLSKKGSLADYFNLDDIMPVYQSCGIELDRAKMEDYFNQELKWFGLLNQCPIDIHNTTGNEELACVGLLFGYPVESTIALIKYDMVTYQQDESEYNRASI